MPKTPTRKAAAAAPARTSGERRKSSRHLSLVDPADRPVAQEIAGRIADAKRIVILGHERPDGDCVGSTVALCSILRKMGHEAFVLITDPIPDRFRFLNGEEWFKQIAAGETFGADLAIVLDTTDLDRLGVRGRETFPGAAIVNIDHHVSNTKFGDVNWVDPSAAAAGELVWRLASCCNWKVPQLALEGLYVALVTDTGQFAYSNTTPRILRMAADLIDAGVDPEDTWRRIYLNKSRDELALETRARNSMEVWAEGAICAISLTHRDFADTGTGPEDTQEFAGIPRALSGARLALFFYEVEGGKATKVSIRSIRELDACKLAQQFGGGGHRQAAGCRFDLPVKKAIAKFRPAAEAALDGRGK